MRWGFIILRIVIGLLFIFSGWIKLYPIEPFEFNFVHIGIANWTIAPFFARGIIAFEILLGLMLIINANRKATIFSALTLLCLFTIYLLIAWIAEGNKDNCGCFGTFLQMSTSESILKNILLILLLLLLLKKGSQWNWRYKWIITVIVVCIAIATPFIINPVSLNAAIHKENAHLPVRAPFEYLPDMVFSGKTVDLNKGEKLLALFSLGCPHCKILATKLAILSEQENIPDVYVLFIGDEGKLDHFLKKTSMPFPYKIFNDKNFFKISGPKLPTLLYVRDGMVYHFWSGQDVPADDIINLKKEAQKDENT